MDSPLVQRYLAMIAITHEEALGRLRQSPEQEDNLELDAAERAWQIRLERGHISSGETSDHPHVDGQN